MYIEKKREKERKKIKSSFELAEWLSSALLSVAADPVAFKATDEMAGGRKKVKIKKRKTNLFRKRWICRRPIGCTRAGKGWGEGDGIFTPTQKHDPGCALRRHFKRQSVFHKEGSSRGTR